MNIKFNNYDIAIKMITVIGGGPIGSIAAKTCAKDNNTILFEEHKPENQPVQCAGLISISGLEKLGLKELSKNSGNIAGIVQNKVRGAKIFSKSGKSVIIDAGVDKALVVDRRKFDEYLLNSAIDSGVEVINKKVTDIKNLPIKGQDKPEKIILATGTRYSHHQQLNFNVPEVLSSAQYEMEIECDPDFVELHFNSPGFFSWIIPSSEGTARIGSCTYRNPKHYLENFIKNLKQDGRIKNNWKILSKTGGAIPIYNPGLRTEYDNIILVGDAAAQVKATTGGGIIMGGIAAGCVNSGVSYENEWRGKIGRELFVHLFIRNFLNRLSEKELVELITLADDYKDIIQKNGDMDMVFNMAGSLMKNPGFSFKIFSLFVRSFF